MLSLLASPWKNEPSIATTVPPIRPNSLISSTKLRFAAFNAFQFSLKIGDRSLARLEVPEQPDQFQIAAGFPLEPTRRPDLVDVTVKIELQQIGRIVRRLSHFFCAAICVAKLQLCKVERANKALDRANRIVRPDIILNPRGKQTGLLPALAGLERAIRHDRIVHRKRRILAQSRRAKQAHDGIMAGCASRMPLREKARWS